MIKWDKPQKDKKYYKKFQCMWLGSSIIIEKLGLRIVRLQTLEGVTDSFSTNVYLLKKYFSWGKFYLHVHSVCFGLVWLVFLILVCFLFFHKTWYSHSSWCLLIKQFILKTFTNIFYLNMSWTFTWFWFGLICLWENNTRSIVGINSTEIHIYDDHYIYCIHNDKEVVEDTVAFLPNTMVIIVVYLH